MALRIRPKVDTKKRKAAYPGLVRVTQRLAQVLQNGLPEPDYNRTLLDLDLAIIEAMECGENGLVVLIETFAGRRNYYGYLAPEAQVAAEIRSLRKRFPNHKITVKQGQDPEWALYSEYCDLFPWD